MKKITLALFLLLTFALLIFGAFSAKAQLAQTQPQAGISNPFYAITVNDLVSLLSTSSTATFFVQPIMNIVSNNSASYFLNVRSFSTTTSGIVPKSDATYSTTECLMGNGTWTNPLPVRADLYDSPTLTMVSTALTATVNVTAGQIVKLQLYTRSTYTCLNTPSNTVWTAYAVAGTSTNATDFTLTINNVFAGGSYPYVDNQGSYDLLITGSGTLQYEIDEVSQGSCVPSEEKYAYQILTE